MDTQHALQRLEAIDRQITLLTHIGAVLEWDQNLHAPAKQSDELGREMGYLDGQIHMLASSDEVGDLLADLDSTEAHPEGTGKDDFEKALIRIRHQDYQKRHNVPSALVLALSEETAKAYPLWLEARSKKDWKLFAPAMERILHLVKERASCGRKASQSLYDVMLDDYEEGASQQWIDRLFQPLVPVVQQILQHAPKEVDDSFLRKEYPVSLQADLQQEVMEEMGFDFSRGLKGVSAHPFTSALGVDDVRITTRYTDPSVMDSFYSTVHETGHALYEQWASQGRLKGTTLAGGASYALHESQSRLWENIIGRSRPFLAHVYEKFVRRFPSQLDGVGFEVFFQAVNRIKPGFIRTNSDEVCYSLHIMLRSQLERLLVEGTLPVADLPQAWNDLSEELLGIRPENDAQGCLQDVHWRDRIFPELCLGQPLWRPDLGCASQGFRPRSVTGEGGFGPDRPVAGNACLD